MLLIYEHTHPCLSQSHRAEAGRGSENLEAAGASSWHFSSPALQPIFSDKQGNNSTITKLEIMFIV